MINAKSASVLLTFLYAAMLGWDVAQLAHAIMHGHRLVALAAGAGAILLAGIIYLHMTKSSRAHPPRRTRP